MSVNYKPHKSVLLEESVRLLRENVIRDQEEYIADLTFGAGGHSLALLDNLPNIKIIALDQDFDAFNNGQQLIVDSGLSEKLCLIHSNFEFFTYVLQNLKNGNQIKEKGFRGILLDLGVSSHLFDQDSRGFSFQKNAPLDMRMNQCSEEAATAEDLINNLLEDDLYKIISNFGEEKFAKRIAARIVECRKDRRIRTTSELEEIIYCCYPSNMRRGRVHPATRTFQALRIAVNRELEILEHILPVLAKLLTKNGRLAVITFHSLEDRIVKHGFKRIASDPAYKILTKKPIIPGPKEIMENFRARSAKLRLLERV